MADVTITNNVLALEGWLLARVGPVVPDDWRKGGVPDIQLLSYEPPAPGLFVEYEGDAPIGGPKSGDNLHHVRQTWRLWLVAPYTRDPTSPQQATRDLLGPYLAAVARELFRRGREDGATPKLTRLPSGKAVDLQNGAAAYPLRVSWLTEQEMCSE